MQNNYQMQQAAPIEVHQAYLQDRKSELVKQFSERGDHRCGKSIDAAIAQLKENDKLMQCNPETVYKAVHQAAQLGLDVGGKAGHAYLVPFAGTAQLLIGYKGLIYMAIKSGVVASVNAFAVYKDEHFKPILGSDPRIDHIPHTDDQIPRIDKNVTAVYAVAKMANGELVVDFMTRGETDRIKNMSKTAGRSDSPWQTNPTEMRKKTIIHRLFKKIPCGGRLAEAVAQNNKIDDAITKNVNGRVIDEYRECVTDEQAENIKEAALCAGLDQSDRFWTWMTVKKGDYASIPFAKYEEGLRILNDRIDKMGVAQ